MWALAKAGPGRAVSMGTPLMIVALWSIAGPSWAHSTERGLVLLLPTEFYITGGAIAVLASFLLLCAVPASFPGYLTNCRITLFRLKTRPGTVSSLFAFAVLVMLVVLGFSGSRDPLANPLPLVTWTGWWVLFTLVQCLTGDLWKRLNPWQGPARIIRKYLPMGTTRRRLPGWTGYYPAILQFAIFAWFELVYVAPEDPAVLAWAVILFWTFNFIAVLVFGEQDWFERGEPFSIFFRFVGAMAPFRCAGEKEGIRSVELVVPGTGLARLPALPLSGVFFVLLTLSTVSFDGLSRTFAWLGAIDVNPLEFPGRSRVLFENTAGLVISFALLSVLFLVTVYLGYALAGKKGTFSTSAGRLVYSIIPISLVFHGAHYLTQILVNGQYLILALNDPAASDMNLLGLGNLHVTTSFLNDIHSVSVIWGLQTGIIAFGHIIGIAVAHMIAMEIHGSAKTATKSQLFLAAFMVGYTVFGLWLLSTASIG